MRTRSPKDQFPEGWEDYISLPSGVNFPTSREFLRKIIAQQTKRRIIDRKIGRGVVRYYADYHQKKNPWALLAEARRQPFGEVRVRYTERTAGKYYALDTEDALYAHSEGKYYDSVEDRLIKE